MTADQTSNPKLARAVIRQTGRENLEDIARHGADAGYSGFTYYSDTVSFFKRNRMAIRALAEQQAEDFGQTPMEMIAGFNCLKNPCDKNELLASIARCLYGTETKHTPGPWQVVRNKYTVGISNLTGKWRLAEVSFIPSIPVEECEANAALIASAPDMAKELAQLKADKAELVFALQSAFDELNSLAKEPNELGPQKQNVSIPICALTLDLARALIKKYENPS